MVRENFFTGEAVNSASPTFMDDGASNASFGATYYNNMPGYAPNIITPGGYGYNQQPQQAVNIGYNPYMQNPYNSTPPWVSTNYGLYQNNIQSRFQQPKTVQFKIEPVFQQEYLPSADWEDRAHQLQMDFWQREQEQQMKLNMERSKASGYMGYGGYYNYYGNPYFNPYQYDNISKEANDEIEKMKQEARQNRIDFQFNLSKLAHSYIGDKITDEQIMERCTGKIITIDNPDYVSSYYGSFYDRFQNLVPYDNSALYREHYAAVSKEHEKYIPKNCDLQTFFANLGILGAEYALEEEMHSRRDDSITYDSQNNAYKVYVQRKAAERYKREKQISELTGAPMMAQKPSGIDATLFPTLSQSATLTEDGTLNITCNFGSMQGETYSVHNSMEAEYEQDKERFKAFVESIPGAIYNIKDDDPGGGS